MKLFKLFLALVLVFALQTSLFALADAPNKTVSVIEGKDQVIFFGTATFTTDDSTNNLTTKAIADDGMLDWENAHLRAWTAAVAGDDVNIFVLGGASLDLTYMSSTYTQTVFDDVNSATPAAWWACKDTLRGTTASGLGLEWMIDPVVNDRFKVIQFDGQAGNTSGCVVSWYLVVPKKPGAPARNAYAIFSTT